MTKKLLILRHAKSNWDENDVNDHKRGLNQRGFENSKKIAEFLEKNKFIPDHILCSSAKRALLTLDPIIKIWNEIPRNISDEMYLASPEIIISIIKKQKKYSQILLIGHNPGLAGLVLKLIGNNIEKLNEDLKYSISKFPTCSLAKISLNIKNWSELRFGVGNLEEFIRPKDIE